MEYLKRQNKPICFRGFSFSKKAKTVAVLAFCSLLCLSEGKAAPRYEKFMGDTGWFDLSRFHKFLVNTEKSQLTDNTATLFIDQGSKPDTNTCYANAPLQLLQTHLFVSERNKREKTLARKLKANEISALKKDLILFPLYALLKGRKDHRYGNYYGAINWGGEAHEHLKKLRSDLRLMKEPSLPGLDLFSSMVLGTLFIRGFISSSGSELPLYEERTFEGCLKRAEALFSAEIVSVCKKSEPHRSVFDMLTQYLTIHPELLVSIPNYNIYLYQDFANVTQSDFLSRIRTLLTQKPHYPISVGTAGHYFTVTGIEQHLLISEGDLKTEVIDLWKVVNSYGTKTSGWFLAAPFFDDIQNVTFIRPCGEPDQEQCRDEVIEFR